MIILKNHKLTTKDKDRFDAWLKYNKMTQGEWCDKHQFNRDRFSHWKSGNPNEKWEADYVKAMNKDMGEK